MFGVPAERRPPPATTLFLLLALASPCTGGDPGGSRATSGASPRASAYVEQVNAACSGLAGDVAAIIRGAVQRPAPADPPPAAGVRAGAEAVRAAVGRSVEAIRAIPPPPSDTKIVASMLSAFDAGIEQLRREPEALESIGTGRASDPFARADRLALGYGADRCALSSASEGGD